MGTEWSSERYLQLRSCQKRLHSFFVSVNILSNYVYSENMEPLTLRIVNGRLTWVDDSPTARRRYYTWRRHPIFYRHRRLSIFQVFDLIIMYIRQDSYAEAMAIAKINSRNTIRAVWKCLSRLVAISSRQYIQNFQKLGRANTDELICADETLVRRSKRRFNSQPETWAWGARSKSNPQRWIIIVIGNNRSAEKLSAMCFRNIEIGARVQTDGWAGYNFIDPYYRHTRVYHRHRLVNPITGVEINVIEGLWGLLKKEWRASRGGISREHCELFIAFFTWKHHLTDKTKKGMLNSLLALIADNRDESFYV